MDILPLSLFGDDCLTMQHKNCPIRSHVYAHYCVKLWEQSPVRAPGCKNGPAPFPGRMSYKATKPGLVFVLCLSMFIIVFGVY